MSHQLKNNTSLPSLRARMGHHHLTPAPLISTVSRLKAWKHRVRDKVDVLRVCDTVSLSGSSGPVTSTPAPSCPVLEAMSKTCTQMPSLSGCPSLVQSPASCDLASIVCDTRIGSRQCRQQSYHCSAAGDLRPSWTLLQTSCMHCISHMQNGAVIASFAGNSHFLLQQAETQVILR